MYYIKTSLETIKKVFPKQTKPKKNFTTFFQLFKQIQFCFKFKKKVLKKIIFNFGKIEHKLFHSSGFKRIV
jgi:hypothetical protein